MTQELHQQLLDCEATLEAVKKPWREDYKTKADYEWAHLEYRREIRIVWDEIRAVMDLWPPGC